MEKENNSNESDFSENEIPNLNCLKPFEFKPKANIGDINSSSSDDEEDIEYKVKQIGSSKWCSKQFKPMKTYTESLCCQERNDIPDTAFLDKEYSSEVF